MADIKINLNNQVPDNGGLAGSGSGGSSWAEGVLDRFAKALEGATSALENVASTLNDAAGKGANSSSGDNGGGTSGLSGGGNGFMKNTQKAVDKEDELFVSAERWRKLTNSQNQSPFNNMQHNPRGYADEPFVSSGAWDRLVKNQANDPLKALQDQIRFDTDHPFEDPKWDQTKFKQKARFFREDGEIMENFDNGGKWTFKNQEETPGSGASQGLFPGRKHWMVRGLSMFGGWNALGHAEVGVQSMLQQQALLAGSTFQNTGDVASMMLGAEYTQQKSLVSMIGAGIGGGIGAVVGGLSTLPIGGVGAGYGAMLGAGVGASVTSFGYDMFNNQNLAEQQKSYKFQYSERQMINAGLSGQILAAHMMAGGMDMDTNNRNKTDMINQAVYSQINSGYGKFGGMTSADFQNISTSITNNGGVSDMTGFLGTVTQLSNASGRSITSVTNQLANMQLTSNTPQGELATRMLGLMQGGGMNYDQARNTASSLNLMGGGFANQQENFLNSSPLNKFQTDMVTQNIYGFKMSEVGTNPNATEKYNKMVNNAQHGNDIMAMAVSGITGWQTITQGIAGGAGAGSTNTPTKADIKAWNSLHPESAATTLKYIPKQGRMAVTDTSEVTGNYNPQYNTESGLYTVRHKKDGSTVKVKLDAESISALGRVFGSR